MSGLLGDKAFWISVMAFVAGMLGMILVASMRQDDPARDWLMTLTGMVILGSLGLGGQRVASRSKKGNL